MANPPQIKQLPYNYSTPRGAHRIEAIIAHGTVGTDSRAYLSDGGPRRISIHALIQKPGDPIYRYVPDHIGANHAGFGTMPAGFSQVNPNLTTLSFELENLQDGKDPYPDTQLLAMGWWINDRRHLHGHLPILRHADIDPTRRSDTVGLSVAEIEQWCIKAAAHYAKPGAGRYKALAPMWISETSTYIYGPIALAGTAAIVLGEIIVIDEVKAGIAHLANGVGFLPIGGLEYIP
jgi:hypothetical protein